MARPRLPHPTPAELEILQVLWDRGPSLARTVQSALDAARPRAYTTVLSLLNLMVGKGFVQRRRDGRAYVYSARIKREATRTRILRDVVERAFDGSAAALVSRLLQHSRPDADELSEIQKIIAAYRREAGER